MGLGNTKIRTSISQTPVTKVIDELMGWHFQNKLVSPPIFWWLFGAYLGFFGSGQLRDMMRGERAHHFHVAMASPLPWLCCVDKQAKGLGLRTANLQTARALLATWKEFAAGLVTSSTRRKCFD